VKNPTRASCPVPSNHAGPRRFRQISAINEPSKPSSSEQHTTTRQNCTSARILYSHCYDYEFSKVRWSHAIASLVSVGRVECAMSVRLLCGWFGLACFEFWCERAGVPCCLNGVLPSDVIARSSCHSGSMADGGCRVRAVCLLVARLVWSRSLSSFGANEQLSMSFARPSWLAPFYENRAVKLARCFIFNRLFTNA
jgi:hypothetical protein